MVFVVRRAPASDAGCARGATYTASTPPARRYKRTGTLFLRDRQKHFFLDDATVSKWVRLRRHVDSAYIHGRHQAPLTPPTSQPAPPRTHPPASPVTRAQVRGLNYSRGLDSRYAGLGAVERTRGVGRPTPELLHENIYTGKVRSHYIYKVYMRLGLADDLIDVPCTVHPDLLSLVGLCLVVSPLRTTLLMR